MNALRKLEQGGIRFALTADGRITYTNTWPGEVPHEWAAPLLARLRARRDEVVAVLRARQEWVRVYDEWSRAAAGDDPEQEAGRDAACLRRLEALAVRGLLPCYDGGQTNLGAAGWARVTERQLAAEGAHTGAQRAHTQVRPY